MGNFDVFIQRRDSDEAPTRVPPPRHPSVVEQLTTLTRLGLAPVGVTAEDIAGDAEAKVWTKRHPYAALLHCTGRDADDKLTHHPKVLEVPYSLVTSADSYPNLVRRLSQAAGTSHQLSEVDGKLDRDAGRCVVRFNFGGLTRELHPHLDAERVDREVLTELAEAVSGPGQAHAEVDHEKAVTIAYAPRQFRTELQRVFDHWN